MAQQIIDIGTTADDGTGDTLRDSFDKSNDNFTELYSLINALGISGVRQACRVATTANGTLATAFAAGQTVDGVTLATDDRILIKDQAAGAENGIYTVNASGAPTRAADADSSDELAGCAVFIQEGTANADKLFQCTTDAPITVDTTALVFSEFSSGGGSGLSEGTSFPGSPADNDRFKRTDLDLVFFYDSANTQWLSETLFRLDFDGVNAIGTTQNSYRPMPFYNEYALWLESLDTMSFRSATGEWDIEFYTRNSAGTATLEATRDGSGDANSTYVGEQVALNIATTLGDLSVQVVYREVSGAASFIGCAGLNFRVIGV